MLPDRVSNPGPLTYESGALPIALRGPGEGTCGVVIYMLLCKTFEICDAFSSTFSALPEFMFMLVKAKNKTKLDQSVAGREKALDPQEFINKCGWIHFQGKKLKLFLF